MYIDGTSYPDTMTLAEVKEAQEAASLADSLRRELYRESKRAREFAEDTELLATLDIKTVDDMWELFFELESRYAERG